MPPLARIVDPLGLLGPTRRAARSAATAAAAEALLAAIALADAAARVVLRERLIERTLDSPQAAALLDRTLASTGTEQLLAQALDSRLVGVAAERLLAGDALWRVVEEVARSPAVTEAIAHQGAGFADEVAGEVGVRTRRADARLERAARRLLGREPAPGAGRAVPPPAS